MSKLWCERTPCCEVSPVKGEEGVLLIGSVAAGDTIKLPPEATSEYKLPSMVTVKQVGNDLCPKCQSRRVPVYYCDNKVAVAECIACGFCFCLYKDKDVFTYSHGGVTVEMEHIGEGLHGDYNPDDPDDVPLLRFTVLKDGEQVDDASYCTRVDANTDEENIVYILERIFEAVYDRVKSGESVKKLCEELSWLVIEEE